MLILGLKISLNVFIMENSELSFTHTVFAFTNTAFAIHIAIANTEFLITNRISCKCKHRISNFRLETLSFQ